jgi:hypothetical protein
MTDFKQWMIDNYSHNELADIANYGCSGGVSGMIYYVETEALYKRFAEDLHAILAEYRDETGESPRYVTDELGDHLRFFGAVVWFAAEWVAHSITHGEYIEEITHENV